MLACEQSGAGKIRANGSSMAKGKPEAFIDTGNANRGLNCPSHNDATNT